MIVPDKPLPGDKVAIVSPSMGLPAIFPRPFELGLRRLREDFGLIPVEYPTTRKLGATSADRAADLHAAFADPQVKAVITSIGGDDQITVIPHLDASLLRAHPKPFFGFSDNTNMLAYLYELGIVSYHGGAVMTLLGRSGTMHPVSEASMRAALFTAGPYDLPSVSASCDIDEPRWDAASFGEAEPVMEPCAGWSWHNASQVAEGTVWGGNLEVLTWLLAADRIAGRPERFAEGVLIVETSEETPSATEVFRMLRNMGERGLLRQFQAVIVGRAKAWSFEYPRDPAARAEYASDQRAAMLRAFGQYAPDAVVVFDVDFGHTDPQVIIPYGGRARVDGPAGKITVWY